MLADETVRVEAEALYQLEVLATVDAGGGEHVVGDGCVGAALESALAVVAQDTAAACEADECLRVDESINRYDAAEFIVGEFREVFVRRARNGVQYVDRCGLDAEFTQIEAHVNAVFHGFAEAHDTAAADFKTCGECVLQGADFIVVGVRGANVREMPAVRFQVVVEAGEACFFKLVELFAVQKPCREAYGKLRLFFEAADGFANLFYVAVRERAARGDDGIARNACGFFFLGVGHDFVGTEQLVFGSAGVVVAALGAIFAVFGATTAAGVYDGAKIEVVSVEFFADFVGGVAKLLEIFAKQLHSLFAVDFVTA